MAKSDVADEYFNRSFQTVAGTPYEQTRVCYAVFCRKPGVLCGIRDVVSLIDRRCDGGLIIRAKSEGDRFEANEIVMTIEGPFGQLVTLETEYLGLLSLSGAATNMAALVTAAGSVPVVDMSARHYPPGLIGPIAAAAALGGAAGTTTRAGHAEAHARFGIGADHIRVGSGKPRPFRLYGTIPHALNAVYGGSSIGSAAAYHERCPDVPLTILIDFEGRERDICAEAITRFGSLLQAVRLDVPENRIAQGCHEKRDRALEMRVLSQANDRAAAQAALDRYGFGPGVTIELVYAIRDLLDRLVAKSTKIMVSGGFDVEKVRAFKACKAPMDAIGTGSWVKFAVFTSDIIRVHEDGQWKVRCKAGRREELLEPEPLPVVLQK
jgi:nicotinate phosphoribosyltransferase